MAACRVVAWGRPPELVEVPVPEVGPGQVLVEVAGCGLCHSDLTMAAMPAEVGEALGWQVPFTLGHEVAGRVARVGPDGPPVEVGTPVALASPASCGRCPHCRAGRESACPHGDVGRGYGRDGGLARYVLVDDPRALLPLGELDPVEAGPLTDAGATSHHAVRRVRPVLGPGTTAVVIGAGGLGSMAVQVLRATTGARIVAVDVDPARREVATALGADEVVDGAVEDLAGALRSAAGDGGSAAGGVDAVVDVVGSDGTIAGGLGALRRGGAFALVGASGGTLRRPWFGGLPREATVTAVQGSTLADARAVIELAAAGRVRVEAERFALADVGEAYAALAAGGLRGRAVVIP